MTFKVYALRDKTTYQYIGVGGRPAEKPEKAKLTANKGAISQTRTLAAKLLADRDMRAHNDQVLTELGLKRNDWAATRDERYQARSIQLHDEEYESLVEYYKDYFEIIEVEFP